MKNNDVAVEKVQPLVRNEEKWHTFHKNETNNDNETEDNKKKRSGARYKVKICRTLSNRIHYIYIQSSCQLNAQSARGTLFETHTHTHNNRANCIYQWSERKKETLYCMDFWYFGVWTLHAMLCYLATDVYSASSHVYSFCSIYLVYPRKFNANVIARLSKCTILCETENLPFQYMCSEFFIYVNQRRRQQTSTAHKYSVKEKQIHYESM